MLLIIVVIYLIDVISAMSEPRRDEIRVGDKVKGGPCCPAVEPGYANDINHPVCATESVTFTDHSTTMSDRTKLFDSKNIRGSSVRSPRAIASTHDSSSRYLRQGEITRRSMISVDPLRTAGIGSALDPADRTCARSRRSPLARPAYARSPR